MLGIKNSDRGRISAVYPEPKSSNLFSGVRALEDGPNVPMATLSISVWACGSNLQAAELKGAVCRDESYEGVQFFENRFLTT